MAEVTMTDTQTTVFPFIVVYENGVISGKTHQQISHLFDLSDCIDPREMGIVGIYAADQDNKLVQVTLGKLERLGITDEDSIIYAHSEILAGTKRVGTVHWSDH